jgi:hypothetical protein
MFGRLVTLLAIFFAFTTVVNAQSTTKESPDAFWNDRIIKINFTGSGIQLFVDDIQSGIPFIKPEVRTLLEEFPDSKASFASYDNKYVTGQIFLWTGLATELGGLGVIASQANASGSQSAILGTGLALIVGGVCAELWGALTISSSYGDLYDAINKYNKEQFLAYSQN